MEASKKPEDLHKGQFFYLGRWVDKENFRAYVYDVNKKSKLANSYPEFQLLIESGIWFADPFNIPQGKRKKEHDSSLSNGK